MSSTFEILKEQYGAVMTLEQLAATLSRKPEGLRMALLKPRDDWARSLVSASRRPFSTAA